MKITQADALEFDLNSIATERQPLRIVGNLLLQHLNAYNFSPIKKLRTHKRHDFYATTGSDPTNGL